MMGLMWRLDKYVFKILKIYTATDIVEFYRVKYHQKGDITPLAPGHCQ